MPKRIDLTPEQVTKARSLRDAGHSLRAIGFLFGVTHTKIRLSLLPPAPVVIAPPLPLKAAPRAHPEAVPKADVAARRAEIPSDTRTLTARVFGDPLPGRSALDRRQQGA